MKAPSQPLAPSPRRCGRRFSTGGALRRGGAAVLLLAALAGPAAGAAEPRPPELRISAPPELEAAALELRRADPWRLVYLLRLVGLEQPGPPIRVALEPETSRAAQTTPPWIAGYAFGALGRAVLFPERTPSYPDRSLDELLRHEVAHVLIHRAAGGRPVPRWLNEGLAMVAAGAWGVDDRSRLSLALLLEDRVALEELAERFQGEPAQVSRAYALSGALVRDLFQRHGSDTAAGILGRLAVGLDFDTAFRRTTGVSLARFEDRFWRRYSLWYRWIPFLTSSFTLWILIVLLVLWAGARRKRRRAELEARWEEEERRLAAAAAAAVESLEEQPEPGETVH